ncbi:MAG: radical SAM protein, partial [Deltaproteobacteria bacterium]
MAAMLGVKVTIVELLDAVAHSRPLDTVPGLSLPHSKGAPHRTAPRALLEQLDELPFVMRYRKHAKHLGVPFIPLMASRGCWGSCSYCSITSFYRDARAHGGGKTFRLRSPENVADEMAVLWHDAGGPSIFCFHDDNFLLPRPADTLARVGAMRARLDELGVGRVGLIGKCRPECVTADLARELRRLGVIRLYVGVENASGAGAEHLNRGAQAKHIHEALEACREAGIFVCYNLLVFEPDATIDDVRTNIAFIRAHANHPMNFCRAEPYHGTPLHRRLERDSNLGGSYLGWNYRIGDTRTEMLFRISSAVFRQRNFDPDGVANRYMGLGYSMKLLEVFHEGPREVFDSLQRRASDLTRGIAMETADFLEEAVALAAGADFGDTESLERRTALLGLRISAADGVWHRLLDDLYGDMNTYASGNAKPRVRVRPPARVIQLAQKMALGVSLAMYGIATEACSSVVVDPVPADVVDSGVDRYVVDPAPVDVVDPMDAAADRFIADPPPPDAGRDVLPDYPLVDPAPWDSGVPVGALETDTAAPRRLALIDQWRSTTPEDSVRSRDLPLYSPPRIRLVS